MSRFEYFLAIVCALVRFAVCCWRAAHQAIIVDEATTYNIYVSGPWRKLFGRYDANNHILSSILIKLAVTLGGLSEFKLRLPSLIAGFFLTLGVFWLLKQVESRALRWAAFAAICLCPFLLDFSIAARGYGLSLAFFVWALYFCLERRYLPAGILLGLSIGANLAILFPVLALFVAMAVFERKPLLYLVLPALLVGALINGPSLRRAHREDFYIGYPEFRTAAISFVATTLYAMPERSGILGVRGVAILRLVDYGLPVSILLVAAASFFTKDRRKLLPYLIFCITLLGLILARRLFGVNYPADRTCLYLIILGITAWAIAADGFQNKMVQALWLLPLLVLIVQFSTQLTTRYFEFWRVEADDKQIAHLIQRECLGRPDNSLTLSSSWMHQPTMEFYRRYLLISALKPVQRFDPTPLTGFDFYVLSWGDYYHGRQLPLRTLLSDPDIEVMLATSSAAARAGN
jgi:4-amino-4-deoxy-L-arabinose transferase-like glycosyltransferase